MFFLKTIAQTLIKEPEKLKDTVIVFPSKRAGLFFKQEFRKAASEMGINALWLPKVEVVDSFFRGFASRYFPEDIELIFVLYEAYAMVYGNSEDTAIPFDEFYPFGETVLRDFQDADSYLADPAHIFMDLTALEKMKEADMETFMQYEAVRRFVENFSSLSDSDAKQRFGYFWKRLHPLYNRFHALLKERNYTYTAFSYRMLVTALKEGKHQLPATLIFAGFNALTVAEEALLSECMHRGNTSIYWKYDDVYLGNPLNEGSYFLRQYFQKWAQHPQSMIIKNPDAEKKKTLRILNSSSPVAQVKYVCAELAQLEKEKVNATLVVLADETLLPVFLASVPASIEKLNVTMGFSVRNSTIYSILITLAQVIESTRDKGIYYKFFEKLVHEVQSIGFTVLREEQTAEITSAIYIDDQQLVQYGDFGKQLHLLLTKGEQETFLLQLIAFFDLVFAQQDGQVEIEHTAYTFFRSELIQFHRIISSDEKLIANLDKRFLMKIVKQRASQARIPFEGEPLEGLQVMGPLEIRVLDFERVFMLSMNDGIYPKTTLRTSLLSFALRKAFSLPTFETQESIYAHHFYALFQSATMLDAHFYTKEGGIGNAEKSRFLTQMLYERGQYPNLSIEQTSVAYPVSSAFAVPEGGVIDSDLMREKLLQRYREGEGYMSPTALSHYLECKRRFYLMYVAGLRQIEEKRDHMESVDIGNIMHKALEEMFSTLIGVDNGVLDTFKKDMDLYIAKAYEVLELKFVQTGYNFYLISAAKKYLADYLERLKVYTPFDVAATEMFLSKTIKTSAGEVTLGGTLDLVMEKNGQRLIIDFKTGRALTKIPKKDDFSEFEEKMKDYKYYFQLLFYRLLHDEPNINTSEVVGAELHYVVLSNVVTLEQGNSSINGGVEFEEFVQKTLESLFAKENTFNKTSDEENCLNCQFKHLCNR